MQETGEAPSSPVFLLCIDYCTTVLNSDCSSSDIRETENILKQADFELRLDSGLQGLWRGHLHAP